MILLILISALLLGALGEESTETSQEFRQPSRCCVDKHKGNGTGNARRYYYNSVSDDCKCFQYSGSGGSENNFYCKEECLETCRQEKNCKDKVDPGYGFQISKKYFYDRRSGCLPFNYTGCGGNGNRYVSKAACEKKCGGPPPKDICKLPRDPGTGNKTLHRYYFDEEKQKCKRFVYHGKGGNKNNFKTEEECKKTCPEKSCTDLPETGPCKASVPSWYYDPPSGKCKEFTYGGCEGNGNRYSSEKECRQHCKGVRPQAVCCLNKQPGNCSQEIHRYYYNKHTKKCERFVYSGCYGNFNNFGRELECNRTCKGDRQKYICSLPSETGPCRAAILRYYFNKTAGRCEKFTYGGCLGNENNFETKDECENFCNHDHHNPPPDCYEKERCNLPPEYGTGKKKLKRFYFDKKKRQVPTIQI